MELDQKRIYRSRKTRKLLFIIVPVIAALVVALLLWRPWYTPKSYPESDSWIHIRYSHAEIKNYQTLASSGKSEDQWLLDPEKTLRKFMETDDSGISFDLRGDYQDLRSDTVQSIRDLGTDPENGDRLFLTTFTSRPNTVVVFRLRQLGQKGTGNVWSIVGYLITPKSTPAAAYSTTWQQSSNPFLENQ